MKVSEEMVSRFLKWPLPKSVRPDRCVMDQDYPFNRMGTHLLTADETRQMLTHVLNDDGGTMALNYHAIMMKGYALNIENNAIIGKLSPKPIDGTIVVQIFDDSGDLFSQLVLTANHVNYETGDVKIILDKDIPIGSYAVADYEYLD